jgi:hypothetical protein
MPKKNLGRDEELVKRLDTIITVLLETARPEGKELSIMEKIGILSKAGLRPVEISKILGTSVNYVNVVLTYIRKSDLEKAKKRLLRRKKIRRKKLRE